MISSTIIPRYDDAHLTIKAQLVNTLIQQKLEGEDGVFINDNSKLSIRSGQASKFYTTDQIHLNEEGSKIPAQNLGSIICDALGIKQVSNQRRRLQYPRFKQRKFNYNSFKYRK